MADREEIVINVTDLERIRDLRAAQFRGWSTAQIIERILDQFLGGTEEIESKHVKTVSVVDPDSGGDVEVEIRKMSTGGMVGLDASWLAQTDEHPFSPYDGGIRISVPDDEK